MQKMHKPPETLFVLPSANLQSNTQLTSMPYQYSGPPLSTGATLSNKAIIFAATTTNVSASPSH